MRDFALETYVADGSRPGGTLLPASVYRSEVSPTPADCFCVGFGGKAFPAGLAATSHCPATAAKAGSGDMLTLMLTPAPIAARICGWCAGVLVLVLSMAATPAFAGYPVAPDVVVFCEPTLRHAVSDVGELWRRQTGVAVRVFTSPTPLLLEQIAHGARDDVLVGESDAEAAAATRRQLIKPQTLQRLWRNQLVVATLAASPPATGRLTSVAGKAPIAIVDPWAATAGADSEKALQSLGLWQAVRSKSIGVVGTADAAFLLAHGTVPLAVVYTTDVVADRRLAVAERLPAASYPPIVYWVALPEHTLSPNAGKFVAFLDEAQARQRLRADGLEVLP